MIIYKKLFALMKERGLSTYKIRMDKIISEGTLTSLRKGENVSTGTIDTLCNILSCQPGDIMEYVPDENTEWEIVNIKTGEFKPSGFTLD